jgi:hypothetical protein
MTCFLINIYLKLNINEIKKFFGVICYQVFNKYESSFYI